MKKVKLLSLVIITLSFCCAYGIIFNPIGEAPMFSYWNVDGQHLGDPVVLQKGTSPEMYICCSADTKIESIYIEISLEINGFEIPCPLPLTDHRVYAETPLPITPDNELRVRFDFPINEYLPNCSGRLFVRIKDQTGEIIAGGSTSAIIKN